MSAHRHQAVWRSITFNKHFKDNDVTKGPDSPANIDATYVNNDYYLDILDIVKVTAQDYRELRQFLEGADPNEAFEGLRAITGHGMIQAPTPGALEDMTWAMYEAFSIAACRVASLATDPPGLLPFQFKRDTITAGNADVKALRFWCRPGAGRPVVIGRRREGLGRPFIFQLLAMDPFAYDDVATTTALANLAGGANVVTNPGNLYTKPKIVITMSAAGGANVTLANTTTGQSFRLNLSGLVNGNVLTLDVARSTMTLADGSNQYGKRLAGYLSQMFLQAGANTITWSDATGITSVQFVFRGAYA